MVTKQMVEAAKKFLTENPNLEQDLKDALNFVAYQPVMNKTEADEQMYKTHIEQLNASLKRDYYHEYIPTGTTRVRSYIFGIWPNYIDEAKCIVAEDAKKMAEAIKAGGFNDVRIIGPETVSLTRGLKVEAIIEVKGKFSWHESDDEDRKCFNELFRKLVKESKKKGK
jgi:hypothetical protein